MAREEADREDLLRQATGLADRAELQATGAATEWFPESIVIGFRRNGAASVYVSQDEVYQFDAMGHWRRSYLAGRLLKAEDGRLVELTRQRSDHLTVLVRRDLAAAEQSSLSGQLASRMHSLHAMLSEPDAYEVIGQVSVRGDDVVHRFTAWLDTFLQQPIRVASRPGLK